MIRVLNSRVFSSTHLRCSTVVDKFGIWFGYSLIGNKPITEIIETFYKKRFCKIVYYYVWIKKKLLLVFTRYLKIFFLYSHSTMRTSINLLIIYSVCCWEYCDIQFSPNSSRQCRKNIRRWIFRQKTFSTLRPHSNQIHPFEASV